MAYDTLTDFLSELDARGELHRVSGPVSSRFEIAAITREDGAVVIPRGDTELHAHDHMVLFALNKVVDTVLELMNAVDEYIELPVRDNEKPFLMSVEDVFTITGRGTVATGRIETGIINTGDEVDILGLNADGMKSTITGVEMFRKILDRGEAGDNVGLLLRGIDKKDIKRGMVIAKPGSVTPHSKFKAEVYILKKEEGGRHTPFHNKYRPQFYFRTTDVTGSTKLPEGIEMVSPGDNVKMEVELMVPIAMDDGVHFAIREGGRTVGSGVVTKIIE